MTTAEYLKTFGLTERQIKIYLNLATYPDSTVVEVNQKIKTPRSTIYLELQRLISLGLIISKTVGKTTFFKITNPQVLKLRLEDQADRLNQLTTNLDSFSQTIKTLTEVKKEALNIDIYRGQEGIKQLLWNILTSRAKLVIGFSPGQLEHITDRKFAEKWRKEFRERKMHNKIIFNRPKPLNWSDIPGFLQEHVEAKTLDENEITFDRMILIYNDVLTICSLKTDREQYGIEIRDRLLVHSYKQLFNFLWEHVAEKLK